MKKTRTVLTSSLLATCIAVPALAENVVKVPRERGAVHQEFKTLLSDYIKEFKSGIGRIALKGEARGDECQVDFYTNQETTFVTVNVDDGDFYNEFYIDHPTESFRQVLFQNLTMHDDGVELKVVKRDGGYSIQTDGKTLVLTSKADSGKDSTCTLNLAQASFFEGETE
ncbi:MAG: hypothetical protein R3208_14275 [Ketobacteraceae bacterium]|nr:hypothetical protein [Ketobacteraceae bacterium]